MKKIILAAFIGLTCTGTVWSQGCVNWSVISFVNMSALTNSASYSPFFGGGSTGSGGIGNTIGTNGTSSSAFRYELLYGAQYYGTTNVAPTTLNQLNSWSDSGLSATNSSVPSRLVSIYTNSSATTPVGWNAGTTNYIIMVGWSANLGSTWATAKATLNSQTALASVTGQAFFGISSVGYINPNTVGSALGATLFGTTVTASGRPINSPNTTLYLVPAILTYPPVITSQPTGQAVAAGASVNLSVQATNYGQLPMSYQWRNSSGPITDATNFSLTFNPAQTNNTDNYRVVISDSDGSVTSSPASLMVYQPVSIITPPANQLVSYGGTATFGVVADGFPAPAYQWSFNGTNLYGATTSTLTISGVVTNNLGNYTVQVSNTYSSAQSAAATLRMLPSLVTPFTDISGLWGQPGTLSVGAVGSGTLAYQWYKDGVALPGATGSTYSISSLQFTNGGSYSVVVTSAYGSVTNTAASLTVRPSDLKFGTYAGVTVQGTAGNTYLIQYSTDLVNWVTATNVTLDSSTYNWADFDIDIRFNPGRYYRVIPAQ